MADAKATSTGHELSDGQWLDVHYESARPEYEAALRNVGVPAGATVLDAGCGGGGFLPALCELVGPQGAVTALDLAPENVALVEARVRSGILPANVGTQVGSVLALPFADATFDHVWCANVAQYLTASEFTQMAAEFKRVAKPGALITVKDYDSTLLQLHPLANDFVTRLWLARRDNSPSGVIGPWGGTSIPSRLRAAGLVEMSQKGWLVERWAPPSPATRALLESLIQRWANFAARFDLPAADLAFWDDIVANPGQVLDHPADRAKTRWKTRAQDSVAGAVAVEFGMAHISGFERDQLLLLPEAVDDYVGSDNPVRFIDAFVDGLDLVEAGFGRVQPKATGRPGYAPGDLLKLYIYGYLNRVRSSRRLEAECHRNIEVIWLLRTLKPDFKTIADFRADNRAAFKAVFRAFTLLCKRLDLFGRELLAVDGTRIKAVNNKDRNFTRNSLQTFLKAADERLADYLKRLDEGDAAEKALAGARVKNLAEKIEALSKKRSQYAAMLKTLERTGEDQISLTDPDSRAMAAHTRVAVGYNVQVAVDAENKLIVEQDVTNQVVDMGLLQATAEPAREILGVDRIDVVADKGYFRTEDIEACEKAGLTPYVPRPQRGSSAAHGFFRKDEFVYDAEQDAYVCPAGQVLSTRYESKLRAMKKVDYANRAACAVCPLRPRCTKDFRKVSRLEGEAALDRMAERLKARPEILDRRRETVEHPFGSIKQWMYQGAFLMRGLDKVRAEFSLTALAYNLRRALNLVGVEALMAAAAAAA